MKVFFTTDQQKCGKQVQPTNPFCTFAPKSVVSLKFAVASCSVNDEQLIN